MMVSSHCNEFYGLKVAISDLWSVQCRYINLFEDRTAAETQDDTVFFWEVLFRFCFNSK